VYELKEGKVDRKLLLGYTSMGPQPGAQKRPEALHGVNVDLVVAIAVLVTSVLTSSMANRLVFVAPNCKTIIDIVLISINQRSFCNNFFDDRLDGILLDIVQHLDDDFTTPLD
jgi:hypothetical protein